MIRVWGIQIWRTLADDRFRALLHSLQLMLPVALEGSGPLVKRAQRFGIGPVQLLTALAAHATQPHVAQHAQVLGDGRLLQTEGCHNRCDRPLGFGKIAQDIAPARFSHRVESIRGGGRSCHDKTIYSHMGICQAVFFWPDCRTSDGPGSHPADIGAVCFVLKSEKLRADWRSGNPTLRKMREGWGTKVGDWN